MSIVLHFFRNESGATAIEYGLIAALVVLAATAAMTAVADQTIAMYGFIVAAVQAVGG